MTKYYRFSVGFYLFVLGLTTPVYLLLYGASGHGFHFNMENWAWILTAIFTFIVTIVYLFNKEEQGLKGQILKVGLGILLLTTLYGGLRILIYMISFKFGSDVSIIIKGLGYIVPMIFIASNCVILLELLRELGIKKASAANTKT